MPSTTTAVTTVRDKLNSPVLGKAADEAARAPLGDILAVLLDAANPNVVVAATTVGAAVANTGVASPANAAYTQADQTALATCVLALVTQINLLRTDVLALRAELASALAGTVGGATETGLTVTSNAATLTYQPTENGLISVRATTGSTTGVLRLVRDRTKILATGEVFWDGVKGLTFAAVDAVTAIDVIYARSTHKASCLMSVVSP